MNLSSLAANIETTAELMKLMQQAKHLLLSAQKQHMELLCNFLVKPSCTSLCGYDEHLPVVRDDKLNHCLIATMHCLVHALSTQSLIMNFIDYTTRNNAISCCTKIVQ